MGGNMLPKVRSPAIGIRETCKPAHSHVRSLTPSHPLRYNGRRQHHTERHAHHPGSPSHTFPCLHLHLPFTSNIPCVPYSTSSSPDEPIHPQREGTARGTSQRRLQRMKQSPEHDGPYFVHPVIPWHGYTYNDVSYLHTHAYTHVHTRTDTHTRSHFM
jgi:hypothetical protein